MNTRFDALLEILTHETACYREMQTLLAREEASISLSRSTNFDHIQAEKETLVDRLQKFERRRQRLVDQLAGPREDPHQPVTVREVAQLADAVDRRRLLDSADDLRAVVREVQIGNRRNRRMIDQNLGLIKGSLKLLTQIIDGSPVYRKPGNRQATVGYRNGGGRFIRGSV